MITIDIELQNLERDFKEMDDRKEYIKLSFHINQKLLPFLQKHNHNGKYKDKIHFYKGKLREVGKMSINEMNTIEFETPIDWEKTDKYIKHFTTSQDLQQLMYRLGSMVPKNDEVIKASKETMPLSYQFASRQSINDNGDVISWEDDDWYYNMYRIHQSLSDNFREIIFLETIASGLLTENWTIEFVTSKPLFHTYSEVLKFAHGVHNFFSGDYVSCLHILIPLFERVLINVSWQLWLDIIALLRWKEWIWTKTIGKEFINSPEFQEKWSVNLSKQINFVLYDNHWYNLRNSLAHGEIEYTFCDFQAWSLVIYLYIAVATRLKVQIK